MLDYQGSTMNLKSLKAVEALDWYSMKWGVIKDF